MSDSLDPRVTEIAGCRSCGSHDLQTFLDLGEMPLSDGLRRADQLDEEDPRFPLETAFCMDCGLVQIRHTVAPEVLFADDYPYFSSFSDALVSHAKDNVDARIDELGLDTDDVAIELASNDGYLLQHYAARGIKVRGIDPARGPVEAARARGIETTHAFLTEELARELAAGGLQASVLHANNVLAHVADTNGFVQGIGHLLADDGVAVLEVPYLRNLIDEGQFDTIYHEHLCYFSALALDELFRRAGLTLFRVEKLSIHGGSLRLFVSKSRKAEPNVAALIAEERAAGMDQLAYYQGFSTRANAVREGLRRLVLDARARGLRVAAYGAAAKGAIMLESAGLGPAELMWVADRNVHKHGRFMPGNHLEIVDTDRILREQPDLLVILPWNFKDEIIAQQTTFARRGGRFVIPIPEPTILPAPLSEAC